MIAGKSRVAIGLASLCLVACGGAASTPGPAAAGADVGSGSLTGAGATFPEPYYTKAFYLYSQKYPKVTVNYQAIGSGGGIQQFTKGTVDFGASDVPMNAEEIAAAGGDAALVQFPSILGVDAIAFNVKGLDRLQLDGPTLAGIFLGKVKRWDDPAIKALNRGARLPGAEITVVHRSDGSGTTYAFTDYLAKVSDDWRTRVGVGKSVQWPAGIGGKGNEGVGQAIKSTDNSIGYVELAYVVQSKLQAASLKNRNGRFVVPSLEAATAAAGQVKDVSSTNFSITDQPGDTAYPITTFSWVMLRKEQPDAAKGKAAVNLWRWVITDGQAYGRELQYAPLPREVQDYALATLKKVTSGGRPILG